MKFDFKGNLKKGFTPDALIQDALSILAAIWYRVVPSLFGMSGIPALLVGGGIPILIGKLMNWPGISHAAIGCSTAHLLQYAEPLFQDLTGKNFWVLGANEGAVNTAAPLQDRFGQVVRPGQGLFAYNPDEVRRLAQSPVSDGGGIADRVGEVLPAHSQSVVTPGGRLMSQPSPFVHQQGASPFAASGLY